MPAGSAGLPYNQYSARLPCNGEAVVHSRRGFARSATPVSPSRSPINPPYQYPRIQRQRTIRLRRRRVGQTRFGVDEPPAQPAARHPATRRRHRSRRFVASPTRRPAGGECEIRFPVATQNPKCALNRHLRRRPGDDRSVKKEQHRTAQECPASRASSAPDSGSQARNVPSSPPETASRSSEKKQQASTVPMCPSNRASSLPLLASQTRAVPSCDAETMRFSVEGETTGLYRPLVADQAKKFESRRYVPHAQRAIVPCRGQPFCHPLRSSKSHTMWGVAFEPLLLPKAIGVPEANCAISSAGGEHGVSSDERSHPIYPPPAIRFELCRQPV